MYPAAQQPPPNPFGNAPAPPDTAVGQPKPPPKAVCRNAAAEQFAPEPSLSPHSGRSRHPLMLEQMDSFSSIGGKAKPTRKRNPASIPPATLVPSPAVAVLPPVYPAIAATWPASPANHQAEEDRNKAISTMRRLIARQKGEETRKKISVRRVAEGIVHVRINADNELMTRIGMPGLTTPGSKLLDYLAINPEAYQGQVASRGTVCQPGDMSGEELQQVLSRKDSAPATTHAFINGGFFKHRDSTGDSTDQKRPTIGKVVVPGVEVQNSPIPEGYESDYHSITFADGSIMSSAPLLSLQGVPQFLAEKLQQTKYQFSEETNQPGVLGHSSHPNPRSAVVIPDMTQAKRKDGDAVRFVFGRSATSERGANANGYTMPEWSTITARLDNLNRHKGFALNMDGGRHAVMGVVNEQGEKVMKVSQIDWSFTANFIAFSKVKDGKNQLPETVALSQSEGGTS